MHNTIYHHLCSYRAAYEFYMPYKLQMIDSHMRPRILFYFSIRRIRVAPYARIILYIFYMLEIEEYEWEKHFSRAFSRLQTSYIYIYISPLRLASPCSIRYELYI